VLLKRHVGTRIIVFMPSCLMLLLLACTGDADSPAPPATQTYETDTGTIQDPTELSPPCEAPSSLPEDPITGLGSIEDRDGGVFFELTDVEVFSDLGFALGVGQGGLTLFDVRTDPPTVLAQEPEGGEERYVKVERLSDELVALTNWNPIFPSQFAVFDLAEPENPALRSTVSLSLATGMAWTDPLLYVLSLEGEMSVLDLSNPDDPQLIETVGGLQSPYEMLVVNGWGYVADTPVGIVPVDLTDPETPSMGSPVASAKGAWDLAAEDTWLYVAAGSAGLLVYDLVDPAIPALVAQVSDLGNLTGIDVDNGLLVAVSHQDFLAFDVTDPTNPLALGRQPNGQFGLAVQLDGRRAYVADWSVFSIWETDPAIHSPEAVLESSSLWFYDGDDAKSLGITNLGADTLNLVGATLSDPRLTLVASRTEIPPGEAAELVVTFERADEGELDAILCLATNDPDEPVTEVQLATTDNGGLGDLAVGQAAPDFTLDDLEGVPHRLSDQLGSPVILVYFSTW
jgi:hypothetical protein